MAELGDIIAGPAMQERTLGSFVRQQEAKKADPTNWVDLTNQGATRNLPITDALQRNIISALSTAYGPGYRAQVYSGGQPAAGSGGARVGSTRHDGGDAADVYIMNPQGRRLTGDELAPLARHWLKSQYGGVGLEMKGGGIHLDTHTNRAPVWTYGAVTPAQVAVIKEFRGSAPTNVAQRSQMQAAAPRPAMPGQPPQMQMPMMAPQQAVAMPQPPALPQMALASMFAVSDDTAKREREAREQAERSRRLALFGEPGPFG